MARGGTQKKEEVVAVAVDKDKGSQHALKWTVDRLLSRGQVLTLLHVKQKAFSSPNSMPSLSANADSNDEASIAYKQQLDNQAREFFLPFRCLCTRKDIKCNEVILEDVDIAKTLINYVNRNWIDILVLGVASKGGLVRRFKCTDVPSIVSKGAPEFCTVYIIAKGKVSSVRQSTSILPSKPITNIISPRNQLQHQSTSNSISSPSNHLQHQSTSNSIPSRNQLQHQSTFNSSSSPRNQLQHQSTSNSIPSPRKQLQHQSTSNSISSPCNQLQHQCTSNSIPSPHHQLQHQSTSNGIPSPHQQLQHQSTNVSEAAADTNQMRAQPSRNHIESIVPPPRTMQDDLEIKSPFTRPGIRASMAKGYEPFLPDSDISFVGRGRPSIERIFPPAWNGSAESTRLSNCSDLDNFSSVSSVFGLKSHIDSTSQNDFSSSSQESDALSWSSYSQGQDDVEAEMRRLKLELKQTMDMYSTACREAHTAKQKANELHRWKLEEEHRLEEARSAEEAALALAEKERERCKVAMEAAEASKKIAKLEARKRVSAEKMADMEADEAKKSQTGLGYGEVKYRRYTIEDIQTATEDFAESLKIGEGGYGPVYRGDLDHTPVAIKVLRPDAAQGRSQFQQEVEVLSCIRHPNMVLLLGACPEYGCLVYEYMAKGSLEDCLFRRDDVPVLPWQLRFRIAAEIATGLLFLHQTKPEPIVHRDLKPGNILLDHNYVSKISDVGLARLVPPSVANSVTQYRMTTTAGTFCYIDPEYQQTGLLGIKSDIYSFGVMLLQIITSRPPIGLTHAVERSIERGNFAEMLDPEVPDWPVEEALKFAKLSLQCAEMRKRDRPDLGTEVLPELNRLRALAEESMGTSMMTSHSTMSSPCVSQASFSQEIVSPHHVHSGSWSGSSRSQTSSTSSFSGRRPYWLD